MGPLDSGQQYSHLTLNRRQARWQLFRFYHHEVPCRINHLIGMMTSPHLRLPH